MPSVPLTALHLATHEMKALLGKAQITANDNQALFESMLFNRLLNEQGDAHIKQVAYFKASRIGATLPLTRRDRAKIFNEVNRYIETKFNNYMIKEYGYC